MNKLIIVESKNKIKSIEKYIKQLQKEGSLDKNDTYVADGSVGHILELPSRWLPKAGETEWDFEKKVIKGKGPVITALKKASKKADLVLIATDPDREGEAIADDLVKKLGIEDKYERITFTEITKDAILEAINSPSKVDTKMVEAQIARLILDRVYGYNLSKWLRFKIWNDFSTKSAGRVQSPTLKLVVERELLIEGFKPDAYVKIQQDMGGEVFADIVLKDKNIDGKSTLLDPKFLPQVKEELKGKLTVTKVSTKKINGNMKTPFKQSAVYRSSGMSAAAARAAMQGLYEKGLISYPRTDSTRYSQTFINMAKKYINAEFGPEYVSENIKGSAAGKQDAHEALRVTDPANTPDKVKLTRASEVNMYKLIYNHTLQTLMTPPLREVLSYKLDDNGYEFKMSSSKVLFKGYLIVSGYQASKELPKLSEGESIQSKEIIFEDGATKPKSRYNEGSLISKMEEVGIGRPSTFSTTVNTLKDRKREYVTVEGKAITASSRGKAIVLSLILFFDKIIDEKYTNKLEESLDKIYNNEINYKEFLSEFNNDLHKLMDMSRIKQKSASDDNTVMIDLAAPAKKKTKEEYKAENDLYSKPYEKLLETFMKYVKVTNKDIDIDYKGFIDNEYDNFKGQILMPASARKKSVAFVKVDGLYKEFDRTETYPEDSKCTECKKGFRIARQAVRRGKKNWFTACSNFPKCKHTDTITDEEQAVIEFVSKND